MIVDPDDGDFAAAVVGDAAVAVEIRQVAWQVDSASCKLGMPGLSGDVHVPVTAGTVVSGPKAAPQYHRKVLACRTVRPALG